MAKEPFAQFLDSLLIKLRASTSQFIKDPDNVVIGENVSGLVELPDYHFPRIEILIVSFDDFGYRDQRIIESSERINLMGHIRRDDDRTTAQDMYDAIDFGIEMRKILYSFNTDRLRGIAPCDGFIQMSGFSKTMFEYELFPKITSVGLQADAEIQLNDTYTNN